METDHLAGESAEEARVTEETERVLTPEISALLDAPAPANRFSQVIVMMVVTLVLFVAGQSFGFGTAGLEIAIIVGVLVVHELGHLTAMRLVGYRDLSMFFIPLVGAAATGRKDSASAGQQAFVTLAGPIPGIALGILAAVAWAVSNNEIVGYAAVMLLALNLLNLLPVNPLDGGRFLHVILLSRFPALQLVVDIALGGLLLLLAWQWKDWFLGILGAFSLVGAFRRLQASRLARSIRPLIGDREATETIPEDLREPLARVMAATIPADVGAHHRPEQIAAKMKLAWKHATFRPASISVTFAALGGYAAAFVVPAIFGIVMAMASSFSRVTEDVSGPQARTLSSGMLGVTTSEIELDADNQYHGMSRTLRFPSETLWIAGDFEHGHRTGTWRVYAEDGSLEAEMDFENGELQSTRVASPTGWEQRAASELPAEWEIDPRQSGPYTYVDSSASDQ